MNPPKTKEGHFSISKAFKKRVEGERKIKIDSPTPSEKLFDNYLDILGIQHNREKPFYCGIKYYFADFYIPAKKIVIEIDGGYHNNESQIIKDKMRTSDLINQCGVSNVIRFTNDEVLDEDKCLSLIIERLDFKK